MKSPYLILPLKYGVAGGVLSIILFFIVLVVGGNPLISNPLDFIVNSVILLVFIIFSIREFKKIYNSNTLHFWQGINVGFFTAIIIGFTTSFFIYIHLTYINPELLASYRAIISEQLATNKEGFVEQFGEEVYNKSLQDNESVTPLKLALDELIKKKLVIGFFITTIISVVMRQQPLTKKSN
ncbi:hypothetical protein OKW21_001010 [Catalinimonas alkaloidigena]|uniref:DUF4199 domain-containing protein n=1 Tax=Catalinimonas alkaloidigena TaxID=1075417 RepID=UPI00240661B9|nr:DUF4199 domain-containing protein [Catalinimonas alkaloidigena]MDF9795747.1 hypothetical protein [Catalinimonas alkaloidigena]